MKTQQGPDRPSHFREDPNQRTDLNESELDYPDEAEELEFEALRDRSSYGFETEPQKAVPVYLTEPVPADRVYVDWSASTHVVNSTTSTQVASVDRRRTRCVVRNVDDTNAVVCLRDSISGNFLGYQLPPGEDVEFLHTQAVWVRSVADNPIVAVFSEYEVDDDEDDNV